MLGIVSDSHGQHARLKHALRLLAEAGATQFAHCGDLGGERVLDELAGYNVHYVWGNTDFPDAATRNYATQLGLHCHEPPPTVIKMGDCRCKIYHGHEREFDHLLRMSENDPRLFAERVECDFILTGHTHRAAIRSLGPAKLVNPGALHRAKVYTVAMLDPAKKSVQHYAIEDDRDALQPYALPTFG